MLNFHLSLDLNPEFKDALRLIQGSSRNLLILGRAGTGKSTFLDYFRAVTKKQVVVLAPTGVAAVNVKGETIHSFFRFKPNITLSRVKKLRRSADAELYQKLDTIVIDEISMVRADLLDCVDKFLRLNGPFPDRPFGGVQMVFIGDLFQLPPVITSQEKEVFSGGFYQSGYFFSARVFEQIDLECIEFNTIYRQKDDTFISVLNAIRNNRVSSEDLDLINSRVEENIDFDSLNYFVCLTPTNRAAERINSAHLARLRGKAYSLSGKTEGDFDLRYLPADKELRFKNGAQMMLLHNDDKGRWVNGTVVKVAGMEEEDQGPDAVIVKLPDGSSERVYPYTWELFHSQVNASTGMIETEAIGKFTQYPLKLAWAMTIHKSQGKTFDRVIIDIGNGAFAGGQVYVALSRCRSLEGIILVRPIEKHYIFMDEKIVDFVSSLSSRPEEDSPVLS